MLSFGNTYLYPVCTRNLESFGDGLKQSVCGLWYAVTSPLSLAPGQPPSARHVVRVVTISPLIFGNAFEMGSVTRILALTNACILVTFFSFFFLS